jgi:hypothetical protein
MIVNLPLCHSPIHNGVTYLACRITDHSELICHNVLTVKYVLLHVVEPQRLNQHNIETHEHLPKSYQGTVYALGAYMIRMDIEEMGLHGTSNKQIKWAGIKTQVFDHCGMPSKQQMNTYNTPYNVLIRMPTTIRKLLLQVFDQIDARYIVFSRCWSYCITLWYYMQFALTICKSSMLDCDVWSDFAYSLYVSNVPCVHAWTTEMLSEQRQRRTRKEMRLTPNLGKTKSSSRSEE